MARLVFAAALGIGMALTSLAAGQSADSAHDKNLDVRSSAGDLHLGNDATAQKAGFALYPGARLAHGEENNDALHLGILTEAFGLKLMVTKYESDDAPGKVIDFYREKLKKYGKVLECRTGKHEGGVHAELDDDKDDHSKELKCEGDNTGPVTELKVGTQENQHVVAIEPRASGKGTGFALVYVRTRGKQGEI